MKRIFGVVVRCGLLVGVVVVIEGLMDGINEINEFNEINHDWDQYCCKSARTNNVTIIINFVTNKTIFVIGRTVVK